ncbi:hypothetical protein [Streptomyces sp. NPDC056544]|uniref:hypothetical protein n=1 Tax=unclassified Streptomyces TaxID=2593676 RepID=UPI0036BB8779
MVFVEGAVAAHGEEHVGSSSNKAEEAWVWCLPRACCFQDRLELWGIAPLPGRDHDGQGLLSLLDGKVDFGGQSDAGTSEAVVGRLDENSAGRLLLQVPLFAAPAAC